MRRTVLVMAVLGLWVVPAGAVARSGHSAFAVFEHDFEGDPVRPVAHRRMYVAKMKRPAVIGDSRRIRLRSLRLRGGRLSWRHGAALRGRRLGAATVARAAPTADAVACDLPGDVILSRPAYVVAVERHDNGTTNPFERETTSVTRTCWRETGAVKEVHRGFGSFGRHERAGAFAGAGTWLVYVREYGDRYDSIDEVVALDVASGSWWAEAQPDDVISIDTNRAGDVAWIRAGWYRGSQGHRVEVRRQGARTRLSGFRRRFGLSDVDVTESCVSWRDSRRRTRRSLR